MTVEERVLAHAAALSPAEQRVAEALLRRPQLVAFGTVAALAEATTTSGATVVRLAHKLGFNGFAELQSEVQSEMSTHLGAASDRIRDAEGGDPLNELLTVECANIEATLRGVDRDRFRRVVQVVADTQRHVWIAAGDCLRGVASTTTAQLFALRPGVSSMGGNPLRVGRALGSLRSGDVVVVMDFARYDKTILRVTDFARSHGAHVVALTDSAFGPLGRQADDALVVSHLGVGPFDSVVSATVVCQALVAAVARTGQGAAAPRLAQTEAAWRALGGLSDP